MTTALVVHRELTPSIWQMIQQIAPTIKDSRLFGIATSDQAAAIMIKGYELGFSLSASFENIVVIEGKPALVPRGALALIFDSPLCAGVKIDDETDKTGAPLACKVWMKRRDGFEYTVRFTMEDAKRAGLVKDGSGWQKYPANMLRWRAIGFCADVVFPDVLGGLKRADELGAEITQDGDMVEGSWTPAPTQLEDPQPRNGDVDFYPKDAGAYLSELVGAYGAEAVMAANGGTIPATLAEMEAVDDKFRKQVGA